jgi:hypothetical protein
MKDIADVNDEYPSTSTYALHGQVSFLFRELCHCTKFQNADNAFRDRVIVLEAVNYSKEWLAYLKPRKGNSWFKFWNEIVTKALYSEVFNDNFESNDRTTPTDSPLTTLYILVYLQESRLNDLLGGTV